MVTQPAWRVLIEKMTVPGRSGTLWTLAIEGLHPGRLMKIEVLGDPNANPPTAVWKPKDFLCSADGAVSGAPRSNPLLSQAPLGALIAKIGGSTADNALDKGTPPAYIVFAVGRCCIFKVPDTPIGALFLGVNDLPELMPDLQDTLSIAISEAL